MVAPRLLARYRAPSIVLTTLRGARGTQHAVDTGSVLTSYPLLTARKPAPTVAGFDSPLCTPCTAGAGALSPLPGTCTLQLQFRQLHLEVEILLSQALRGGRYFGDVFFLGLPFLCLGPYLSR